MFKYREVLILNMMIMIPFLKKMLMLMIKRCAHVQIWEGADDDHHVGNDDADQNVRACSNIGRC